MKSVLYRHTHLTSTLDVVCALLTQPCWWYRPLDVQHSVTVPSQWLRHVRGTACNRAYLQGKAERGKKRGGKRGEGKRREGMGREICPRPQKIYYD